jgi:uncharacterized protein YicC (UPF0701 family)
VRRSWLVAAVLLLAAAVVAVILVVALRGNDDSGALSATEWAGAVCTSLSDWRSSITALADVSGGLTQESLRERLAAAAEATTKLTTDLRALGAPGLEAGDALKQELEGQVDALESSYEELRAGAEEAIESDSPTGFLGALAELAPAFQRLLDQIASLAETLQESDVAGEARDELRQAFEDAEPCQALRAEG